MAEAIARRHIDKGLLGPPGDTFVASAGIGASDGVLPTHETLITLADMGIEYDGRSKRLTEPMVRRADLVFCMTSSQQTAARSLVLGDPTQIDKIIRLDPENDIEDPIGLGQPAYDSLGRRLAVLVPQRLREIMSGASYNRP
jgi:protein-tyrosine-phosphatase